MFSLYCIPKKYYPSHNPDSFLQRKRVVFQKLALTAEVTDAE